MWKRRQRTEQSQLVTEKELADLIAAARARTYSPAELATALAPYLFLQEVRRLNTSTDKLLWITWLLLGVTILLLITAVPPFLHAVMGQLMFWQKHNYLHGHSLIAMVV